MTDREFGIFMFMVLLFAILFFVNVFFVYLRILCLKKTVEVKKENRELEEKIKKITFDRAKHFENNPINQECKIEE